MEPESSRIAQQAQSDWELLKTRKGGSLVQGSQDAQQALVAQHMAMEAALKERKKMVLSLVPAGKLKAQAEFFDPPEWAGKPKEGMHLAVYKGNEQIDCILIDSSPYYLFGRNASVCDIELNHQSISRVHFALIHHQNGSLYVMDMGTQHGTFIRGERIEARTPVKLNEGDELRAGMSSRLYRMNAHHPKSKKRKVASGGGGPSMVDAPMEVANPKHAEKNAKAAQAAALAAQHEMNRVVDMGIKNRGDFWAGKDAKTQEEPKDVQKEQEVKVSHILIKHANSKRPFAKDGSEITRTEQEALGMVKQLQQSILLNLDGKGVGHDFGKAAKKHSECPQTGPKKGLIGVIQKGSMVPAFEAVALSLNPGEVSNPVLTELGVHLIYRHE
eukprot:Sspe_Gene.97774::Locus_71301_Transcript_1_1_Confidence_1.000_Length_1246::g.97774::m.97774/K13216/PPP1R8, NIPP1; nuclear inhibitor of protein phosphatase 1